MVSSYSFSLRFLFCVSCISYLFFFCKGLILCFIMCLCVYMCALPGKIIYKMTCTVLCQVGCFSLLVFVSSFLVWFVSVVCVDALQWLIGVPNATTFMGCIGRDEFGKILEKKVIEAGVNPRYKYHDTEPTGTCAVCLTGTNRSVTFWKLKRRIFSTWFLQLEKVIESQGKWRASGESQGIWEVAAKSPQKYAILTLKYQKSFWGPQRPPSRSYCWFIGVMHKKISQAKSSILSVKISENKFCKVVRTIC